MIRTLIETMAYGGYGVARVQGKVHFVPGSAPGDLVEIEPVQHRKHYTFSRLLRVVEPSPKRTEPFCPYFGECGGCQLQHIQYTEQLQIKKRILLDQIERIGGLTDIPEPGISGSQAARVRMRFQVRQGEIGLFRSKSHQLCSIDRCGIASLEVNRVLHDLQQAMKGEESHLDGSITVLALPIGAIISASIPGKAARILYDRLAGAVQGCTILDRESRMVLGESYLAVSVQGIKLHLPADAFWQANPEINEVMVGEICRFMDGVERVADLYCGCGNITLPLAEVCKEVIGIDRDIASVDAALFSAFRAGIRNVSFSAEDVLNMKIDHIGGLVLDPPRSGLPTTLMKKIRRIGARRIAYLSCNPSTLARDMRRLLDMGYVLKSLRLLDMFPQTYHIETLSFFEMG